MNVLMVLAHPEPRSFCAALCQRGAEALRDAGHTVTVSDLHAEGFDPVPGRRDFTEVAEPSRFHYQTEQAHAAAAGGFSPDLAREQSRLAAADLLVPVFPLWWGGVPAMLKGWFERLLAYGFAYADGLRFEKGVFSGRRAMVAMTTGGTEARFGTGAVYGELETQVLWQVQRLTLAYIGFSIEAPFVAYGAPRVEPQRRAEYLDELASRLVTAAGKPVDRGAGIAAPLNQVNAAGWSANR